MATGNGFGVDSQVGSGPNPLAYIGKFLCGHGKRSRRRTLLASCHLTPLKNSETDLFCGSYIKDLIASRRSAGPDHQTRMTSQTEGVMDENERRVLTILKALFMGRSIDIGDRKYVLSEDYALCVPAYKQNKSQCMQTLLKVNFGDVSLEDYLA